MKSGEKKEGRMEKRQKNMGMEECRRDEGMLVKEREKTDKQMMSK